jgi:hypothetical protein
MSNLQTVLDMNELLTSLSSSTARARPEISELSFGEQLLLFFMVIVINVLRILELHINATFITFRIFCYYENA